MRRMRNVRAGNLAGRVGAWQRGAGAGIIAQMFSLPSHSKKKFGQMCAQINRLFAVNWDDINYNYAFTHTA